MLDASVGQVGNNVSYTWSTANGNIISITTDPQIELNAAGEYILTVVNLDNGCSAATNIAIAENLTDPIAAIEPAPMMNCLINEITLDGGNSSSQGIIIMIGQVRVVQDWLAEQMVLLH